MPPVSELTFRRAIINLADAGRLGEGEDLNDAILDFFIRLGQWLIPQNGDEECPLSYLGSIFWKQLRGSFSNSGEEGWKNVQNWAKRKAGGMFKKNYGAFAVPINEDLKDDKGQDAGNHWWLALVLNPGGGALKEPTAVMCLDSMQRRTKVLDPAPSSFMRACPAYNVRVTEVEQAGYLIIVSFDAVGDGSLGPLTRPEPSQLLVDGYTCVDPELGLKINMPGEQGTPGRFQGTLTFAMDGKCRSSVFELRYGDGQYGAINLEFDPFQLTRLQKDVSRYLGGYLAKEWEMNGPAKTLRFEKQAARALVADVHQQENLNDCGVYVLENTLRSLTLRTEFLRNLAEASSKALSSYPWPSQEDITARKTKLKGIVARLFSTAAEKGISDVEKLLKEDDELKAEVLASLRDGEGGDGNTAVEEWSTKLQKELAARQVDKEKVETEFKQKEEAVQARREEERKRREEEEKKAEEDRLEKKRTGGGNKKNKHVPDSPSRSPSSSKSRSPSRSRRRRSRSRSGGKKRNERRRSPTPKRTRRQKSSSSSDSRKRPAKKDQRKKGGRRSDSRSRSRGGDRRRDRRR